jgi:hypothetical protein
MKFSNKTELIQQRQQLIHSMQEFDDVIAGSFFEREMNGHKRYCLSRMQEKGQRQCYVSAAHAVAVRKGVERYAALMRLIRELSEVNMDLIKLGEGPHA